MLQMERHLNKTMNRTELLGPKTIGIGEANLNKKKRERLN